VFSKAGNSFPREEHVLLKPANVNILLSLSKDLLMSKLAIDFRRGSRYWVSVITKSKILGIGIKIKCSITQHYTAPHRE